jgi:hypothetical protein
MSIQTELHLSQPYKFAQRAFAAMLDRRNADVADVFAARNALGALDRSEHAQLGRWLAWQSLARNPQALARIERTDARLAAQVLRTRGGLLSGGRPRSSSVASATLPRTA